MQEPSDIFEENQPEQPLPAGLYIVATPIGNLGDISRRAINTLKRADIIACEDTRVTGKLLNAYLIKKPLIPYHEHNGAWQRPKILDMVKSGKAVALVSDAGTPLISDPGYKLVADMAEAELAITTLPGPSAATAALTLAGLPTDRFTFLGFSPNKSGQRQSWFGAEKDNQATLIFYESGKRLAASLKDAALSLGDRSAAVCREISKKFEEVKRGTISELAGHYANADTPKGEIVVVVGPPAKATAEGGDEMPEEVTRLLTIALKHMPVKTAAAFVAEATDEKKNALYKLALSLSGKD